MPVAIIIGFEYNFNSLTGAIIDIYNAYKWCESFGCQIHVITDIKTNKNIETLKSAIVKKIVSEDILTFYDRIPNKYILTSSSMLINIICNILGRGIIDEKLIIYYSGHGVKDSIVIPDKSLLPFIAFRDVIIKQLSSYTEVFWILDCCNPNGLHLPYILDNNQFILSSSKIECVRQTMLLITSSEENEKSIATKHGSVFSRHLFHLLNTLNNRNLKRLLGNISGLIRKMNTGYAQTVSVYSSYITDPILWMWIGSNKDYDIVPDITLSMLIIRTK